MKYSQGSDKLSHLSNFAMSAITDPETNTERVLIFGGIQNEVHHTTSSFVGGFGSIVTKGVESVKSFLANNCYLLTVHQRSSKNGLFFGGSNSPRTVKASVVGTQAKQSAVVAPSSSAQAKPKLVPKKSLSFAK